MIHIIKGSFPKVSYTQTWDIKIYKIEVVGQNAQKMQKSQFLDFKTALKRFLAKDVVCGTY